MRWLAALVIALFVGSSAGAAEAQAFKPRGGAKTAKKAPAKKKTTKAAPRKKAPKKSRAAKAEPKEQAPEDADDYVLIEDDDA